MKFLSYLSKSYHRNLLETLLNEYKHLIRGKILDIGSRNRRYDKLFKGDITAIDIIPRPELNVIKGDIINLQYESNSFDSIICIEVLEYLEPENFKKGFEEIYRVLKKNGRAIISIPFYYHDFEDTMRVTINYVINYLKRLTKLEFKIIKIGNKYTAIFDIIRYTKKLGSSRGLENLGFKFILFIFYLLIKTFKLENIKDVFYSGIFIILHKK